MMPNKDGIETLQELKGQTGGPNLTTPVICLRTGWVIPHAMVMLRVISVHYQN